MPRMGRPMLTPLRALQGVIVNAAWAAGEEARAGRVAVACRADPTVPAEDPPTVPDTELAGLPVLLTVALSPAFPPRPPCLK